uniref:AN1-type domain-containing protein n=1 Tax=Trichuris muris TaxID=70415 RepID=A0A5S6Q270_TRIMR
MEFPDLGCRCSVKTCQQLDFLPIVCDACGSKFCKNHYAYGKHNCPSFAEKDAQVPVCPLCNQPVSCGRDLLPDVAVSAHIDRGCKPDSTLTSKPIYSHKCSLTGCGRKEIVPIMCSSCSKSFCLKHRHPQDHRCSQAQSHPVRNNKTKQNHSPNRSATFKPSYDAYRLNGMTEEAALQEAMRRSLMRNGQGQNESAEGATRGGRKSEQDEDCTTCTVS